MSQPSMLAVGVKKGQKTACILNQCRLSSYLTFYEPCLLFGTWAHFLDRGRFFFMWFSFWNINFQVMLKMWNPFSDIWPNTLKNITRRRWRSYWKRRKSWPLDSQTLWYLKQKVKKLLQPHKPKILKVNRVIEEKCLIFSLFLILLRSNL